MEKSENQLKFENYRVQLSRLKSALNSGFNLEAIFIEYAIMEDRTESILRHSEKWDSYLKSRKGREPTIDSKIRYVQKLAEQKKTLLNKYFGDELLSNVLTWKDERNRLIHALLRQKLEHDEIKDLAEQGNQIVNELRKRTGNFNRTIDKRKEKGQYNEQNK